MAGTKISLCRHSTATTTKSQGDIKEEEPMKLIIEGDAKEFAALVLELQERQFGDVQIQLDTTSFSRITTKAIHDTSNKEISHPMVFDLKKYFFGKPNPQVVEVTFQLAYPDWCKLEDSDVWRHLEEVVGDFQKAQGHLLHQVPR